MLVREEGRKHGRNGAHKQRHREVGPVHTLCVSGEDAIALQSRWECLHLLPLSAVREHERVHGAARLRVEVRLQGNVDYHGVKARDVSAPRGRVPLVGRRASVLAVVLPRVKEVDLPLLVSSFIIYWDSPSISIIGIHDHYFKLCTLARYGRAPVISIIREYSFNIQLMPQCAVPASKQ